MNKLVVHSLTTVLLLLLLGGCTTFPGFNRPDYQESSEWYGEADVSDEDALAVEPELHRITPALLQALNSASPSNESGLPHLPEPAAIEPYQIGVGDLLGVVVYGHPDITNPAGLTQTFESSGRVVDAEGRIFIPFAGALQVAGMTTTEARGAVADELRRVINDPQVDIRVLRYRSKNVYVTGDIDQPCTIPIEDIPLTIVDALRFCKTQVSGPTTFQEGVDTIRLLRGGQSYLINLSALYRSGGGPVPLQDGDRLIVDNRLNRVFVIGEFERQAAVSFSANGMTLADAMAEVGGLDLENADTSGIFVIRGKVETIVAENGQEASIVRPSVYHLDATAIDALILADQFRLHPRDVIYAAPASLVNFNRALAQITPSIDALFRTVIIFNQVDE